MHGDQAREVPRVHFEFCGISCVKLAVGDCDNAVDLPETSSLTVKLKYDESGLVLVPDAWVTV